MSRYPVASSRPFPTNVKTSVAITEVIPALPRKISIRMIFLLAECETTYSLSLVVKPVPEKADWAWKEATSLERPVISRATAPILTIIRETVIAKIREIRAISPVHPAAVLVVASCSAFALSAIAMKFAPLIIRSTDTKSPIAQRLDQGH